jgi:hypothetical protein
VYLLLEMRVKPEQNAQNLKQSKLYQPPYPPVKEENPGRKYRETIPYFPGFTGRRRICKPQEQGGRDHEEATDDGPGSRPRDGDGRSGIRRENGAKAAKPAEAHPPGRSQRVFDERGSGAPGTAAPSDRADEAQIPGGREIHPPRTGPGAP